MVSGAAPQGQEYGLGKLLIQLIYSVLLVPSVQKVHGRWREEMKAQATKAFPAMPMALNFVREAWGGGGPGRVGGRTEQLIGAFDGSSHDLVWCSKNCYLIKVNNGDQMEENRGGANLCAPLLPVSSITSEHCHLLT